jgi:ParB-like chromosome segregation protein Spo0J
LNDGRHRLQAAKRMGAKNILATIRFKDGSEETTVIPIPQ